MKSELTPRELSPREKEAVKLLAAGHCDKSAAVAMGCSLRTFRQHVYNAQSKLKQPTRIATVAQAIVQKIVTCDIVTSANCAGN